MRKDGVLSILFFLFLCLTILCNAQTSGWSEEDDFGYRWRFQSTSGFNDISTTGTQIQFSATEPGFYEADDEGYQAINLPGGFTFPYFGQDHSTVYVHTNGFVCFQSPQESLWLNQDYTNPNTLGNIANKMIAAFWEDHDNVEAWYLVSGSAPYRSVTIQWNVSRYGVESSNDPKFQIILYEEGKILFCFNGDDYFDRFDKNATISFHDSLSPAYGQVISHNTTVNEIQTPDDIVIASNINPYNVSLSPTSGSGTTQTFTISFGDPNGTSDLYALYLLFNDSADGMQNTIFMHYRVDENRVYLMEDDGENWISGTYIPGTTGQTVGNSQGTIDVENFTVTWAPNDPEITLSIPITFNSSFAGIHDVSIIAKDSSYRWSGWDILGSWTVP